MMETPDTTEAVAKVLAEEGGWHWNNLPKHFASRTQYLKMAEMAIETHNKALAEAMPERQPNVCGDWQLDAHERHWTEGFNEARRLFLGEQA